MKPGDVKTEIAGEARKHRFDKAPDQGEGIGQTPLFRRGSIGSGLFTGFFFFLPLLLLFSLLFFLRSDVFFALFRASDAVLPR